MDFNLVNLALTVKSDDVTQLSLSLPLMGKEFAAACRTCICSWPERVCSTCSRQESCAWHLVFGQRLSSDPSELKRHQKPPLPFVFSFPTHPESSENPLEIEFGLVVIGQAIPHLSLLLEGFAELLSNETCPVTAELIRVGSRDYQGTVHPLHDGSGVKSSENLVVLSSNGLVEGHLWDNLSLQIRLLSPLKIVADGRPLARFNFGRFTRSLMRRVTSLAYYYGACEYRCDFKELSRQADAVECIDDQFSTAGIRNRKMSGIAGSGSFRGDFSGLMPFLVAGLYLHVGKGASFGMGMFEMLPVNNAVND